MLLFAPLAAFVAFLLFFGKNRQARRMPEERILLAATAFSVAGVFLLEGWSLFRWIAPKTLAAGWGLIAAGAGVLAWRRRSGREASLGSGDASPKGNWPGRLLIASLGLSLGAALVVAILAPPNGGDGWTYHMARVFHWAQNGSVAYYPTHILRQVQFGPGAEYAILHLRVLWGGDRFANLVQWLAWGGCFAGASCLARDCGAGRIGRLLAMVLVATLPMGILQATGTQNDLVLSFWLLATAHFLLRFVHDPAHRRAWALALGAAAGMALLTKGTAWIFLPPLAAALLLFSPRPRGWKPLLLAAGVALLLNLPHLGRNLATFGHPLGAPLRPRLTVEWVSPRGFVSNVARNAALHLAYNYNPRLHGTVMRGLEWLHAHLGLDMMDQRITWGGFAPTAFSWTYWHENYAGNGVHFLLFLGAAPCLWWLRGREGAAAAIRLYLGVAGGALLFCLLVKVQFYHSRLHTPLFLLACPVIARWAGGARREWLPALLGLLLFALSVPVHLYNQRRPLVGPVNVLRSSDEALLFAGVESLRAPITGAVKALRALRPRRIGFVADWDALEYPYWYLLEAESPAPFRVQHVLVRNATAPLAGTPPFRAFRPDVLLDVRPGAEGPLVYHGETYAETARFDWIRLCRPSRLSDAPASPPLPVQSPSVR